MALSTLLLRLALAFVTLFILTQIMGRKEISQMTFFNFISAISIGAIGASLARPFTQYPQWPDRLVCLGSFHLAPHKKAAGNSLPGSPS